MEIDQSKKRGPLLDPLDRISEVLFGLIMAVTIVGSMSIANAGRNDIRMVMVAALGCNVAWGLVDAVMYLMRTGTERTRNWALAKRIAGAETMAAHRLIAGALPPHIFAITGPDELEGMRRRLLTLPAPTGMTLKLNDFLAATGIFLWVVVATFPVVVPFLLIGDASAAMNTSRGVSLAMLFITGVALGRYAGYAHPVRTGLWMTLLGAALNTAVVALGG
jgi:hypothetical protein